MTQDPIYLTPSAQKSNKPWMVAGFASALAIASLITPVKEGTVYTAMPDIATHGEPYTICDGHTGGIKKNQKATQAQCDAWLASDIQKAADIVARCIHVPLNVNQAAALYDTTFNVGQAVVCGSTLQAKANAHDFVGMCHELLRWNRAGGRVWKGLTDRRMDAMELCLYPPVNLNPVMPARPS